ncbi:hypothetical protein GCWU000324_00348 [Kingella oralis ATCC 51147]|uniref:Uncharacterized protein n=1 Tax=Kingella oralis ATCC 51147 TaxID=629741 RepID=C4GHL4_9NEIS|nr:hypothetical protein GCWU000324_00348 [Kingella oralis ATCC 51147]
MVFYAACFADNLITNARAQIGATLQAVNHKPFAHSTQLNPSNKA